MRETRRKSRAAAPSEEFQSFLAHVWGEPRELRSTAEEMAARRDARVRETVRFAYDRVPRYASAMKARGLRPADLRTASDLARLPLIEPADLLDDESFLPSGADLDDLLSLTTSGSTGEPRVIHHDLGGLLGGVAVGLRGRAVGDRLLGRKGPKRTVYLALEGNGERVRERIRETIPALRSLFDDPIHISAFEEPARVVEELRRLRPDHLGGYASAIGRLFRHIEETGVDLPLPRLVTVGYDALAPAERRLITEEFGIPVLANYGSTEAMAIAFECGEGEGYHVNEDASPLRIVDSAGEAVEAGEPGAVVLSNLVNRGTIVLNYRIGDLGVWIPEPCACGRPLPRIRLLEGRDNAWIERPGEPRLHSFRLANALTRPDVGRWQIAQPDPERVVVRVLPQGPVDEPWLAAELEEAVRAEVGPGLAVEIEFPPVLETTAGGKVLSFTRR